MISNSCTIASTDAQALLEILLASPQSARAVSAPGDRPVSYIYHAEASAWLEAVLLQPLASTAMPLSRTIARQPTRGRRRLAYWLEAGQWFFGLLAGLAVGVWLVFVPIGNWLFAPVPRSQAVAQSGRSSQAVLVQRPDYLGTKVRATPTQEPLDYFLAPRSSVNNLIMTHSSPLPDRVNIPAIQVDQPVVEVHVVGDQWEVASYAVSYLHGTAYPGEDGNAVLAGHAGFFGGAFAQLGWLKPGDDIYVDAGGWRYHYRVDHLMVVPATQTDVLRNSLSATLTLITCTNWDLDRLVVIATLVGERPH